MAKKTPKGSDPVIRIKLVEPDLDLLRYVLGAVELPDPVHWGWKNHYSPDVSELPAISRLQGLGMIESFAHEDQHFYRATRKGCEALGLSEPRIEVALSRTPT